MFAWDNSTSWDLVLIPYLFRFIFTFCERFSSMNSMKCWNYFSDVINHTKYEILCWFQSDLSRDLRLCECKSILFLSWYFTFDLKIIGEFMKCKWFYDKKINFPSVLMTWAFRSQIQFYRRQLQNITNMINWIQLNLMGYSLIQLISNYFNLIY